jgi:hypothetical protein
MYLPFPWNLNESMLDTQIITDRLSAPQVLALTNISLSVPLLSAPLFECCRARNIPSCVLITAYHRLQSRRLTRPY